MTYLEATLNSEKLPAFYITSPSQSYQQWHNGTWTTSHTSDLSDFPPAISLVSSSLPSSPIVKATRDYMVPTGKIQNNLHLLRSAAKFP